MGEQKSKEVKEMVKLNSEMEKLAQEVISETPSFEHLKGLKIGCLQSDKKKKNGRKTIFGECEKVTDKWRELTGYDFLITFYADAAEEAISKEARKHLMIHELKHVGYDPVDESRYIVPHDVEDFQECLDLWGINWITK